MQIHGALLALHTNRPVKIVYNREESFTGHVHRHPARIWAEHRATREGKLVNVRMRILLDGGAYASSSTAVCSNAASFACGPYAVPNALLDSTVVYTNNPPCGAMRGFGAVQTCFAAEAQMDKLAAALGIDPVELRLLNAMGPGDTLPTGQQITGSLPGRRGDPRRRRARAARARGAAARPAPAARRRRQHDARRGRPRGVGFAVGFKNIGFSEGFDDYCAARVRLFDDGSAEVLCAAAEVGQGVQNVMLQVARTELGIDDVQLAPHSTASVDSAGSTSASRQTWMVAGAVREACRAALAEREARGRRRGRRRARLPPPADDAARSRDGPDHRRPRPRRLRGLRDARRRRGRRRPRPHARRLDRRRPGRRQGDQPARGRGPGRGRHRAGPRPRADGGDPDARRQDHERELHRLPDPDRARHAAGRDGARRGRRSRTRRTA